MIYKNNQYKQKESTIFVVNNNPIKTQESILIKIKKLNTNTKISRSSIDYFKLFDDIYNKDGSFNITSLYPYGKDFILSIKTSENKYIKYIRDFFPYFFASKKRNSHYIETLNNKILVTYEHPGFTKKIRENYLSTFEADILYDIRFMTTIGWLLKKYGYLESNIPYRKWYCDIEVYVKNRERTFDPTCKENFINVINIFDNREQILYTILLSKDNKIIEDKFIVGKTEVKNIIINCIDEKEVLLNFFRLYKEKLPDYLIYWNAPYDTNFIYHKSLLYIEDIIKEIKIVENFFDDKNLNKNYFFEDKDYINETSIYHIYGSTTLDLLYLYKVSSETREEYGLDYITTIELGEEVGGKVKYEGTLEEIYNNDIQKFLDYSRKDAYLLYLLDNALSLTDKFIQLSYISLLPIRYFNRDYSTKLSDCIYLQHLINNNMCMLTKSQNKEKEKYVGAHVHLPIPGIYGWFCDLDASSMYPSIIISANISIDTFLFYFKDVYIKVKENNEEKLTVDKELVEKIREYLIEDKKNEIVNTEFTIVNIYGNETKLKLKDIKSLLIKRVGKGNYVLTPAGAIFRIDIEGSMPSIMKDLLKRRKFYKKLKKLCS